MRGDRLPGKPWQGRCHEVRLCAYPQHAVYAEAIKTYIVAPETNEFNIEYLRFEKDTPLPKELKTMVHVAYKVDDLDEQVKANTVVVEPWFADENTRLAFIMKDGILMELMEVK